jgi:ATP-dependent helicase/nuclease subunit B
MSRPRVTLAELCSTRLLDSKRLVCPSLRVGQQWIESLIRSGKSIVNLSPATLLGLMLEAIGPEMADEGLTYASPRMGELAIDAAWSMLPADGYLGRLERTPALSATVFHSLLSLRMAGISAGGIDPRHLESRAKVRDLDALLEAYESFLRRHKLLDVADIAQRAIHRLKTDANVLGPQAVILIPEGLRFSAIELRFLNSLPPTQRIDIVYPADRGTAEQPAGDANLLQHLARPADAPPPRRDGTVAFFHAVGEGNEVREVLRRCLASAIPLDDVEILHTDTAAYVPLIFGLARRYFSEPDRPEGIPVTFAEGIPANLSRPGRALARWLEWIAEGYPQRLLVEMIGEGLLRCGKDGDLGAHSLARLLRPIAIGGGSENYLPKLDEQIAALKKSLPAGDEDARQARQRRRKGLRTLRRFIERLLDLSRRVMSRSPEDVLAAAETFLEEAAHSVSELDRYAAEALTEQIAEHRAWLREIGIGGDPLAWLKSLPAETAVLGSGPRPGALHVAHVGSGGQSGRTHTFVVGLDDRRFPGAALQDPVLLDRERARLSPELPISAAVLRERIEDLAAMLGRLPRHVTLSWPCRDLSEDRETFPSPVVLAAYRLASGEREADMQALAKAIGPPASFAPQAAEQALDETERWLWQLTAGDAIHADRSALVEARYPHLARGSAAAKSRLGGDFGPFNGCVPQAGAALNPFSPDGPILSASALETAGRCPLAFFFRYGLQLYFPEEMELDPDRWLNAAEVGLLMHDVFRRFLSELAAAGQLPQFDRDHTRLAQVLHAAVLEWRKAVPPHSENAFRTQYWQLVRIAHVFLQEEETFCRESRPRFFEVALGPMEAAGESPLDGAEPAVVRLPSGSTIRTKGRIDRVDETAPSRYAVWDYKLGSGYGYNNNDPFCRGRRVQNVLYTQMIEAALRQKIDPRAEVVRFGYFFPGIRAHGRRVDWDAEILSPGMAMLERLCSIIAAGAFHATDLKTDCDWCDYRSVCGDVQGAASHTQLLLARDDIPVLVHFRELRNG